jgi:hypothetical protein
MVLKVVRGKILETLELSSFLDIREPFRYWAWNLAQLTKVVYFQSVAGFVLLPNRSAGLRPSSNKKLLIPRKI